MSVQALLAVEARLRKLEGARAIGSRVRSCILYFDPGATDADHDHAFRGWCDRQNIPHDGGPFDLYVVFMPRRGSSDRSLPEPVESEGGWLARHGLMKVHQ